MSAQPCFHTLTPEAALQALGASLSGLTQAEAQARLESYGPNELAAGRRFSPWGILLRQFANLLIIILLAAAGISLVLGERLDAGVILAIVAACVLLGFFQEFRAEKAAAALARLAAPQAVVCRQGEARLIPAREVVPGDLLILHAGDKVAADGRLVEAVNLMTDEALLTGESRPVAKSLSAAPSPETPLAEQEGMVFGGSVVTYGRGAAVVTATGRESQFGRIARMLEEVPATATPLEKRVAQIGRGLSLICLAVAGLAVGLGVLKGYGWLPMLIWGLSLAVAAVPESLPAVVTGALAVGTTRMAQRRAIVKRLPAVETMGCTTVICTDKTGTLTKNEMTVCRLYLDERRVEVSGSGYEPRGEFREADYGFLSPGDPVLQAAARIALLCNDASLREVDGQWQLQGDPTEGALLAFGAKAGLDQAALRQDLPRLGEIPFDSRRQRMSTIHQDGAGLVMFLKGAPESLLPCCHRRLTGQGEQPLTDLHRRAILAENAALAGAALRVLGLAYRTLPAMPALTPEAEEEGLVWVALVGMLDPPRPEAREAVARCHQAGINVIMLTGDHPDTAAAIGAALGLTQKAGRAPVVLTGRQLAELSDPELAAALGHVKVFARVAPEHKLRLVEVLKGKGEIVAMTGDGVNDAPALKRADIGVAMGITGTEVTKETAAIILADDNFATLVAAVEEGRAIFDNIKKYLIYLLSCNLAEIVILTGAFLGGLPLPLTALQILWVNLTTDGLPALALGVDPKPPDLMARPPRPPREGVFNREVNTLTAVLAGYKTLIIIPLFAWYGAAEAPGESLARARTMVLATLVFLELVNAFNCRAVTLSLFTVGWFANRFLVAAVLLSLALTVAVVSFPPLTAVFRTVPLSPPDWLLAAGLSLSLIPVAEGAKFLLRRRAARRTGAPGRTRSWKRRDQGSGSGIRGQGPEARD